jgi:hypothetical protein
MGVGGSFFATLSPSGEPFLAIFDIFHLLFLKCKKLFFKKYSIFPLRKNKKKVCPRKNTKKHKNTFLLKFGKNFKKPPGVPRAKKIVFLSKINKSTQKISKNQKNTKKNFLHIFVKRTFLCTKKIFLKKKNLKFFLQGG